MPTIYPLIITAGEKYNDIDALACAVGYKKLLDLKNTPAKIIFPGPLNESVTNTIKGWDFTISTTLDEKPEVFNYILVDISEPSHFADFVVQENIVEVYDHRHGFEDYWKEKLGDKSHIELVGACATLIWEEFKKSGLENKIDTVSANLLYTAVLSNTLNLQAQVTCQRDVDAVSQLVAHINLPENWRQIYFDEVSREIMADPLNSMTNDTKVLDINDTQYIITQLELWSSKKFVDDNYELIIEVLADRKIPNTFLTCPSISDGFNYLVAIDDELKRKLTKIVDAEFIGNIGKTKKLWLRKEIMRLL